MEVIFRNHKDGKREYEVVEFHYPGGRVSAFPANERDANASLDRERRDPSLTREEATVTFAEAYPNQYFKFKNGDATRDRIRDLELEQEAREAEIKALKEQHKAEEKERKADK